MSAHIKWKHLHMFDLWVKCVIKLQKQSEWGSQAASWNQSKSCKIQTKDENMPACRTAKLCSRKDVRISRATRAPSDAQKYAINVTKGVRPSPSPRIPHSRTPPRGHKNCISVKCPAIGHCPLGKRSGLNGIKCTPGPWDFSSSLTAHNSGGGAGIMTRCAVSGRGKWIKWLVMQSKYLNFCRIA